MALDTFKITERKKSILDLKKKKGIEGQKARVVLVVDFSGSMNSLYKNGTVQDTVERVLPLGLGFDDDGQVDTYIFHHSFKKLPNNITIKNLDGYVDNEILKKYDMGATSYAPVIYDIIKEFGNKKALFGFGDSQPANEPTYVIFITDGNSDDKAESKKAITEASNHGIFFQFIGIGNETFDFLQKLDDLAGRRVDNADFFKIQNLSSISDDELYNKLMTEFPSYITEARKEGLIK